MEDYRKNIFLIGFMGAGKSAVARTFQKEFGYRLLEMDEEIERREGKSISDIFRDEGEAFFRELETGLLKSLPEGEELIISCGGGTPLREENVEAMRLRGAIVWLAASPDTILSRVKNSSDRPLLNGNMNLPYIEGLLREREAKYRKAADILVSTDEKSPGEICAEIMTSLQKMRSGV